MSDDMEKNGLKLISVVSEVISLTIATHEFETTVTEHLHKSPSFFVAYLDYKVIIGRYVDGKFGCYGKETIDPQHLQQYLQRLRVFNQDEELLLWRSSGKFNGRFRIDKQGKEAEAIEANQVLFGTTAKKLNEHFTQISEQRGTCLILPFPNIQVDDKKQRVFIKTRNYIDYNAVGQANFTLRRAIKRCHSPS
jgi:CRISPR-associated protein (TIGR03984 family)